MDHARSDGFRCVGTADPGVTQGRSAARSKSTTCPSIRAEPESRAAVEAVLAVGQTLSQLVETSVLGKLQPKLDAARTRLAKKGP